MPELPKHDSSLLLRSVASAGGEALVQGNPELVWACAMLIACLG